MLFQKPAELTERSQALDILWPLFRSLHLVGAGPFQRHVDGEYEEHVTKRAGRKFGSLITQFMFFRFIVVGVLRYFFARHLVSAAASDVVRAITSITALRTVNANLGILHRIIRLIDEAPTRAEKNVRVSRYGKVSVTFLWLYVGYRVTLDIIAFFVDDRLVPYLETDLFIPHKMLPTALIPLVYVMAVSDILINRIFVSGTMSFCIFFYSLVNLLFNSKVQHFDDKLRKLSEGKTQMLSKLQAKELRMRHAEFCECVQSFDDVFCIQGFAWHTCCVAIALTESAASVQMMRRNFELLRFLGTAGNLSIMLVFLVAITGSAALAGECNDRSRVYVNAFQSKTNSGAPVSHQIRLLLSQMEQKVHLTAWKIYRLDRGAIITTLGCMFTYVTLVIQRSGDVLED